MPLRYIDVVSEVTGSLPPLPVAEMGPPPLARAARPLRESRVMIVSSAGVVADGQEPFAPVNDLSYRRIPHDIEPSRLHPTHPTPLRAPGLADVNVVHPYLRLAELAGEGFIGGTTAFHLSLLGAIKRFKALTSELGPALATEAQAAGADVVLLVPL